MVMGGPDHRPRDPSLGLIQNGFDELSPLFIRECKAHNFFSDVRNSTGCCQVIAKAILNAQHIGIPSTPTHMSHHSLATARDHADASSDSEDLVECEDEAPCPIPPESARWSDDEMRVLDYYLPRYKSKNLAERKVLLATKILPKLKLVFKQKDWGRRKQVCCRFSGHTHYL